MHGLIKNANSLRRRLKAGEITLTLEVCAGNGCKRSLQTPLYQTYNMQYEMKTCSKDGVPSEIQWYKTPAARFDFLNMLMFIQQSFLEKFDIVSGRHKYMYVCETHPIIQQPEPSFITHHFNCVCSRCPDILSTRQIVLPRLIAHARINIASFFSRWTTIFNVSELL